MVFTCHLVECHARMPPQPDSPAGIAASHRVLLYLSVVLTMLRSTAPPLPLELDRGPREGNPGLTELVAKRMPDTGDPGSVRSGDQKVSAVGGTFQVAPAPPAWFSFSFVLCVA